MYGDDNERTAAAARPEAPAGEFAPAEISLRGERWAAATATLAQVPPEPGVPKPDPILVADNVVRRFGGLTAVDVEHVEIQRGAITALIGPNGAGKTTFFNLLTNFDEADTGEWSYNGRRIDGMAPHKVVDIGMVRTFQLTKALSRLSVIENMRLGAQRQRGENFVRADRKSTRLNSSHLGISYAVFCLKK